MNEQLQNTLAALAAKLGTSMEQLWPLMIKQQIIEGLLGLGYTLLWFTVCYILYRLHKSFMIVKVRPNRYNEEGYESNFYNYNDNDEWLPQLMLILCIAFGLTAVISFMTTGNDIGQLINPEWYALKALLEAASSK